MSALWLGAQNIEQTKFLNWEDLELILGGVVRFPTPQREELKLLAADSGLIDGLWRFNQENLGPAVGPDFYFAPHTKHYTGEQNVLKGWCPKIRGADTVLHSDFIHRAQGAPIYFETTDNFADLRQRFCGVIERARQALQWPKDKVLTLVSPVIGASSMRNSKSRWRIGRSRAPRAKFWTEAASRRPQS